MKRLLFILLFFQATHVLAQTEHLREFYPENILYKKLRVKTVTDSVMIAPETSRITEYDSLGRKLQSYYTNCLKCNSPFVYLTRGDTLLRLQYYKDSVKTWLYSFEEFIYSRSKKILRYTLCSKSYSEKQAYARVNRFFYDDADSLTSQLVYSKHDYYQPVSERMIIPESDLSMSDVIYYTYKKQKSNLLIIARHSFGLPAGRATDSLVYDRQNRLLRVSTFTKRGSYGDRGLDDINRITEYSFEANMRTELNFYTHCFAQSSNGDCLGSIKSDEQKEYILFKKNGLPEMSYSSYASGEKSLVSKYYYTYRE